MANQDYQAQLTQIYNKLAAIDAKLAKLALASDVNTIQVQISASLNNLVGRVNTLTGEVQKLQLQMADLLTELRSK
jgi:hypothetical protein